MLSTARLKLNVAQSSVINDLLMMYDDALIVQSSRSNIVGPRKTKNLGALEHNPFGMRRAWLTV